MAWWWSVLLFIGGMFVGVVLMAALAANSAYFAKEERDREQRGIREAAARRDEKPGRAAVGRRMGNG